MKFLFASDSFKGSLTSEKINEILEKAAKQVFPNCECKGILIADGGEGTLDALVKQYNGTYHNITVKNPIFEDITASYGYINKSTALVEMAAASGLTLIPGDKQNPLYTTTYGTGQLIADALKNKYRNITIAIGGSATNDGGMGAMTSLGIRFLDSHGKELIGTGENLEKVHDIDISNIHSAVKDTKFTVMCDVDNPLLGQNGATYTFGPQKGADAETLKILESGMRNYAEAIKRSLGIDATAIPGGGAAGGLGAALEVFLDAQLEPGIETVLDLMNFDSLLKNTNLVVTGEGRIDWQSVCGKVPSGVGKHCMAQGIPCVAIVGGIGRDAEKIYDFGIESIMSTVNAAMSLDEAMEKAEELYFSAAERMFLLIKVGNNIEKS